MIFFVASIKQVVQVGGKVGIGTTDPSSILDVDTAGSSYDVFRFSSDKDARNDSTMKMNKAGRVGIGNISQAFALDLSSSNNAISGTNVNVSELQMEIGSVTEVIGTSIGLGLGISANKNNIGAAIIFEQSGLQSNGHLNFATKNSGISSGNIPIRMTLTDPGNLGILTSAPTQKLHVIGKGLFSGSVTASCGVLICSDLRYKKTITPLTEFLEKIKMLNGLNYYFRKDESPELNFSGVKQIGLIAQDVEKVYPKLEKLMKKDINLLIIQN